MARITESEDANRPELEASSSDDKDVQNGGCSTFILCDPRRRLHRYIVLVFVCLLSFGSYYCYDNPAALERTIMQVMGVTTTQYATLYSVYSWPNVVLSIFGGVLIDKVFGIRIGTLVFSGFVVLGQLVFALGAFVDQYNVMILGRLIFGLGGENLAVAQNTYAVMWFKGKELNMVFGILLSTSRIGSTVNMNINGKLYDAFGFVNPTYARLGVVLFIGFGFCVLSFIGAILLGGLDWRAARITKRTDGAKRVKSGRSWLQEAWYQTKLFGKEIADYSLSVWLIYIICVFYYVTVFPFIGLATVFLEDKYGFTNSQANFINSLVYIISAVASPFLGFLVDQVGFNLFWLNLGTAATLGAHVILAFGGFSQFYPYLAMVLMGLAYSLLACALWPMVAFIIDEDKVATAYGIMQAIQNLGLAVVPLIAGALVDHYGYLILEVFFLICLCVALIAGVLLYIVDALVNDGVLNMSAWTRRRNEKAQETIISKEETVKLIPDLMPEGTYSSPIAPSSAFHIRNRLLSRMGTKLPEHVVSVNPLTTSYGAHVGPLK